ncbi:MAG: hypothetical protein AUG46_07985 [Acidobacteria bacterium 13_1_20CM_3_58_11]|nr:MAG: hypothetical protein AUG46_07985 [Acidobacteria bacterium 13_1_20CM_3_58_11]
MNKLAALTVSMFLVCGTAFADSPTGADAQPAKAQPAKPKASKKSDAAIAAQLDELRQTLQSQQAQLQMLKEELAKRDRQIDEAREAAAATNAGATEAGSKATEAVTTSAEVKSTALSLHSTVSDLKASTEVLKTTGGKKQGDPQKAVEEGPSTIRYKGVTLTPGGFIAAETVYRQRAESADINTQLAGIPYPGNALSKVSENAFTARQTRATMLAESKVGPAKLTGYFELDFLAAGTTSNNRQSNSYVFRQRQLWAQAAFDGGFSITGGQMWSLATENRKGIQNRGEALPMIIDPQYVVGFTWQRAYGLRVIESLLNNKLTLGASIEGPQTTLGGRGFSTFTTAAGATSQNFWFAAPGNGGGLNNGFDATGYAQNRAPDVVFKAALDPGWGHYEVFGIVSQLRARIYPCAVVSDVAPGTVVGTTTYSGPQIGCAAAPGAVSSTAAGAFNDSRTGGGGGASLRVPLFSKKVEIGAKGVYGDGIGRFGSSQLADATARPDGTLAPIRTGHGLGIVEFHPSPKLDIYAYGGAEYAARAAYTGYASVRAATTTVAPAGGGNVTTTTAVVRSVTGIGGYGNPAANNTLCSTENPPATQLAPSGGGTCAGDPRVVIEGTLGFWHKVYQGPKGGFRWGLTYSYLTKTGWSGSGGLAAGSAGISPKAVNNMVFTSFRYYLP